MLRFVFIMLVTFSLLCSKAKATGLNLVQKELIEASNKLNGLGKSLCRFLAREIPDNYATATGLAGISWIKAGKSFQKSNTAITENSLVKALLLLKRTNQGKALLVSLEKAGIQRKYQPIVLHFTSISKLLNNGVPMAFNSMIQTKASSKAIPFIVFNEDQYQAKKPQSKEIARVMANELYDTLGRISGGEAITATSNYQALGIVFSDVTLKKELSNQSIQSTDLAKMVLTYRKALTSYAKDVPSLNHSNLSNKQKATLDKLTKLATGGHFATYQALNSASISVA